MLFSVIGFSQADKPVSISFSGGVGMLFEELGTIISQNPNEPVVYTSKVDEYIPGEDYSFGSAKRIFWGSIFSLDEWQVPVELGVDFWQLRLSGTTIDFYQLNESNYENGTWVSTSWDATRTVNFNYQNNSTFFSVSFGVGYSLLDAKSRFSIVPLVRFNPEFLIKQKVVKDEGTWELLEEFGAGSQNETSTVTVGESDDIHSKLDVFYKPDLSTRSFLEVLRMSASVKFGVELMKDVDLSLELGYQWQSSYRIILGDYGQKNAIRTSLGVSFIL